VNHPLPWLRYVDAGDIRATDLQIDGMKVRNDAMEKLGTVDGFIVDSQTKRPYYVVVDSGGWFKSKDFLVPIGHATLDDDRDALVVDIPQSRIERFPGFDPGTFERLSQEDIRAMNDAICSACSDSESTIAADATGSVWDRPDYMQPDWWTVSATGMDGGLGATLPDYPASKVARAPAGAELQAERELERERPAREARRATPERDRELVTARETDTSPHFEGRAQPGDVLGVETGGEQTHVGDTREDEDKRRLEAERAVSKRRD
jgi:hypothetical protein